jgi:hypothetical protein
MKKALQITDTYDENYSCFGSFDVQDTVCKTLCALRLRCCIEKDKNARLEILEDMISAEDMLFTVH